MSYFNFAWQWLTDSSNWHGADGIRVDYQRGKQAADLPGRRHFAREAAAEDRVFRQLRPDDLDRYQPSAR